ncbi:MAG: DUF2169 domain-containing protein [Gammaproteobacteria bacterium]|nr:MAG: DUF2169 domain-containing protein [Gammaproteobacteria bacterium]
MLQLKNHTPFSAAFALFPNAQGIDTLYTIVKATFKIGPQWTLAEKQPIPQQVDAYWGEPDNSSLRFASDYHIGKAGTDILMSGYACAPQEQPVRSLDVYLSVGSVNKTLRVFGDRYWNRGLISHPEPFSRMPLVYERAFGGIDEDRGQVRSNEARNPVGCGYAGAKSVLEMDGLPLPNIECPRDLIYHHNDCPTPAGVAPIAPSWLPRAQYAGTYDEQWQQNRAPYLPDDFQTRFLNVAHPDLVYPGFLRGDEPVTIHGMHPAGSLQFNLPYVKLRNKLTVEGVEKTSDFVLETLDLDPNQLGLSLTWRSAYECDKRALKISQIFVSLTR